MKDLTVGGSTPVATPTPTAPPAKAVEQAQTQEVQPGFKADEMTAAPQTQHTNPVVTVQTGTPTKTPEQNQIEGLRKCVVVTMSSIDKVIAGLLAANPKMSIDKEEFKNNVLAGIAARIGMDVESMKALLNSPNPVLPAATSPENKKLFEDVGASSDKGAALAVVVAQVAIEGGSG